MTRIRNLGLVVACGAALATAACGNGAPSSSSGGGGGGGASLGTSGASLGTPVEKVSETDDLKFTPATINAKVGDIIEWSNGGSTPHNVTWDNAAASSLTSQTMNGGEKWDVKFTTAGTYTYQCTFHAANGMKGTVTVS